MVYQSDQWPKGVEWTRLATPGVEGQQLRAHAGNLRNKGTQQG